MLKPEDAVAVARSMLRGEGLDADQQERWGGLANELNGLNLQDDPFVLEDQLLALRARQLASIKHPDDQHETAQVVDAVFAETVLVPQARARVSTISLGSELLCLLGTDDPRPLRWSHDASSTDEFYEKYGFARHAIAEALAELEAIGLVIAQPSGEGLDWSLSPRGHAVLEWSPPAAAEADPTADRPDATAVAAEADLADGSGPPALSDRQRQVLSLCVRGHSNREIGDELQISPRTVERHLQDIQAKLQLREQDLARYAAEHGVLD